MTSKLKSLPEIVFVDADASKVESYILSEYENITGRSLAKGDPVRLFLLTNAAVIVLLLNKINETGKQNLLRYANGNNLDHLGALVGVERIPATAAVTTMQVTLSAEMGNSTVIPAGTRFTAGDNVFFALDAPMIIKAGQTSGTGSATCLDVGPKGNGYIAGQLKTLVDPVPYVASVANITTSEGGADVQDDESYREDIHGAPERFSTAGPDGAYVYHAKRASAKIADVTVWSPSAGTVEVRPLLTGGELPGEELLNQVKATLDDKRVRPLTDKVTVLAPEKVNYTIDVSYYIDRDNETQASAIQIAVNNAVTDYVQWQKSKLGRDVNPSELIARIMTAGAERVAVAAPAYAKLTQTQVAICTDTKVTLGGIEDA